MNIALVSYHDKGAYGSANTENEDDHLLVFLQAKGLKITKVIWNDPQVNWNQFQLAILKSPWDYFDLINDFHRWLNHLEEQKVRLLNPVDMVRWNADKKYLKEIEEAGLNITPCLFINRNENINLNDFFATYLTDTLIIKPVVSGGAKNTFKVTRANVAEINKKITKLLKEEDFIVQPFLPEIVENGEWSFIFFNGTYSHCLIKKAKEGDFRVQPVHGGSIHPQAPDKRLISVVAEYVKIFAQNCLYARVDGCFVNNQFLLMELELIEPFLFLDTDPENYERYYNALKELIDLEEQVNQLY